jgi:hypothetical protein
MYRASDAPLPIALEVAQIAAMHSLGAQRAVVGRSPVVPSACIAGPWEGHEEAMAAAIADLDKIDPAACRESVAARFSPETVAASYVEIYCHARPRSAIAAV